MTRLDPSKVNYFSCSLPLLKSLVIHFNVLLWYSIALTLPARIPVYPLLRLFLSTFWLTSMTSGLKWHPEICSFALAIDFGHSLAKVDS